MTGAESSVDGDYRAVRDGWRVVGCVTWEGHYGSTVECETSRDLFIRWTHRSIFRSVVGR